jgi:hypothetical protein
MAAALLIAIIYVAIIWLVFFKLKLLKFSVGWGATSFWVGVHLVLAFVIGLRYVTPNSSNATVVQHAIQLIPRLPRFGNRFKSLVLVFVTSVLGPVLTDRFASRLSVDAHVPT